MGKNQRKTAAAVANPETAPKLEKGRHKCECQARIHELVHNCLSCGRVVCTQEGSGPCMFCGELVVSNEERAILENGSNTQRKKLLTALTGKAELVSLSTAGDGFQRAQEFRDNLLRADADADLQRRVNDLDLDYHNLEQSTYLTAAEREAIVKRKEELVELDKIRQRQVMLSFSAQGEVETKKLDPIRHEQDPVINAILEASVQRNRDDSNARAQQRVDAGVNADFYDPSIGPKYDQTVNEQNRSLLKEEVLFAQANEQARFQEIEKKGFCLSFDQPFATLTLSNNITYVPWTEETSFRGPAYIAAGTRIPKLKQIEIILNLYNLKMSLQVEDLPLGSVLGRIVVEQCLPTEEFLEEMNATSNSKKPLSITSPFVLVLSSGRALPEPIAYTMTEKMGQLNEQMRAIVGEKFGVL
ncbi:hypothetical protein L596_022577 [Steinernema carpocapsae]|uniref:TRIP4/RQT4 C2HC5-type zinc finger domain-containing protein n=1 Tax=Steinernema carpocapsae TaxID=34508 RepID=A0A4U5MM25_STECR|nr:hypothetical protein L596_022577 [Steinernema carpocapsae]